jgi:hypothetical protein
VDTPRAEPKCAAADAVEADEEEQQLMEEAEVEAALRRPRKGLNKN